MTSTAILIPARYKSVRFDGKPLCNLGGITMIERVYNTCLTTGLDTFVLTDDKRIAAAINNDDTIIDKTEYNNGTERCAGIIETLNYDQYINVQGDMPDITVDIINKVKDITHIGVATAYTKMDLKLQKDPNTVKVVHSNNNAHWFGRGLTCGSHHLGIYGYTSKALQSYKQKPSKYETHEGLEQLRWFNLNYNIKITEVEFKGIEINTPKDKEKWNDSRKSLG